MDAESVEQQSLARDRLHVQGAADQFDGYAGAGQHGSEIAAYGARAHHRDLGRMFGCRHARTSYRRWAFLDGGGS